MVTTPSIVPAVTQSVPTQVIPLASVPAQTLAVNLGGQAVTIALQTRLTGLYADVSVSDAPVAQGVLCLDRNALVRASYTGFQGELLFFDTQGADDPTYDGLGTRFQLVWFDF